MLGVVATDMQEVGVRAVVVQHVPFEGPGLIASALSAAGAEPRVVRVDRGEPLPDASQVDVLVVLGGPMGALVDRDHPYLVNERDLVARCVEQDRPVLGICLGAQLLAAALGARVLRGPVLEVGAGTVTLTGAGSTDPVFGPSGPELPVVHWHHDTFTLPNGAVHVASSKVYPHQAFRVGASYGVQFHVELDADALDEVRPHLPSGIAVAPDAAEAVAATGAQILARWAEHALTAADRRSQQSPGRVRP
ncbi:type 1 glutamine amidotransferase [Nocardia amikacinitolerans]|uniref:type 1 glutamine amidotransferase n=1 Tax=Nocardia amikacinitolerans TaxID=756689 RepID=UPI0020A3E099|nr:type 1 glutamine amidotransferase [Nocardia amikacinitolerans]